MLLVLLLRPRVHQYIIYEHYHKLIQEWFENSVHQVHECCRGICQTERHHQKLIVPVPATEGRLGHILLSDPQLMVTRPQVNIEKY